MKDKKTMPATQNLLNQLLLLQSEQELSVILKTNDRSKTYGLTLTADDAKDLLVCRKVSLKDYQRVEFGSSILKELIYHFCDSPYLSQDNYLSTLEKLQDIFYQFKNRCNDEITDTELLNFMEEQFNDVCNGDTDYLENTCLERFSTAIRSGYRGYHYSDGLNEYDNLDEEVHWDKNLYYEALKNLF